jgi:hypothetical protein
MELYDFKLIEIAQNTHKNIRPFLDELKSCHIVGCKEGAVCMTQQLIFLF